MPLFGSIPANQNVEVDPVWVQPNAPSAPDSGELWWDTDEVAMGTTLPLGVTDGGTGATSPATARSSLAVPAIGNSTTVAGAPTTGTWARGDQYLDSANVVWTCVTAGTPGVWQPPATEGWYDGTPLSAITSTPTAITVGTFTMPKAGPLFADIVFLVEYQSGTPTIVFNMMNSVPAPTNYFECFDLITSWATRPTKAYWPSIAKGTTVTLKLTHQLTGTGAARLYRYAGSWRAA